MAKNLQAWSNNRDPIGGIKEEDPVPQDELQPEEAQRELSGGTKSPAQIEDIVQLAAQHLPEIEESLHRMRPNMLLSDEQELPEDHADVILEMMDGWNDGLPVLLSGITPDEAIGVAEQLTPEIQEFEPIIIGAWLWRAGELS